MDGSALGATLSNIAAQQFGDKRPHPRLDSLRDIVGERGPFRVAEGEQYRLGIGLTHPVAIPETGGSSERLMRDAIAMIKRCT